MQHFITRSTLGLMLGLTAAANLGLAQAIPGDLPGRSCSTTASVQFTACSHEIRDNFFTARAFCTNVSDSEEREECFDEIREALQEENELCREQLQARRDLCGRLGEGRYDPDFAPALFDDDFTNVTNPNPYFPLDIGNSWTFVSAEESLTDEVLNETKLIDGVTCVVVRNIAEADGEVIEITDDWYGQRKNGDVDYCGELAQNFESFAGDNPDQPELVDLDGSFKAGRGAMPGTLFPGNPTVGQIYRQEWSPGEAEDVAEVVSTNYGFGPNRQLDMHMPRALANLMCSNDCVVARDFSPIEPGAFSLKYYARGIGLFFEMGVSEDGEIEVFQLTECNFDPRCTALPAP